MSKADIVRSIAEEYKKDITIDEGNIASGGDDVFTRTLPETLTIEHVKALDTHNTNVAAGFTRAITEMSQDRFKSNESLESLTHTVGTHGKNNMTVTANRDGNVDISILNTAANAGAGELKKAVKDFKAAMTEAQAEA